MASHVVYVGRELHGECSRFALDTYAYGPSLQHRTYVLYDAEAGDRAACVYEGGSLAEAMTIVSRARP